MKRTFKGNIAIVRPNMLQITSPFTTEASSMAAAISQVCTAGAQRGAILSISITDTTAKKQRNKWLKEEYNRS